MQTNAAVAEPMVEKMKKRNLIVAALVIALGAHLHYCYF